MPKGIYKHKKGKESNNWKGGKPKCIDCGEELSNWSKVRKNHRNGKYFKIQFRCRDCFLKKSVPWNKDKKYPQIRGEKHHNWKGGVSKTEGYLAFKNNKRRVRKNNASGSHTQEEWECLKASYNYMCLCCKRFEPEIKLTKDHVIPLSLGGSDNIDNIQPLCRSCNSIKWLKVVNFKELLKV